MFMVRGPAAGSGTFGRGAGDVAARWTIAGGAWCRGRPGGPGRGV